MVANEDIKQLEETFNSGKIEEAEKRAKELLKEHEDDARLYYLLGNAQVIKNDLKNAKENLLKSVSLNSNIPGALNLLGSLFYSEGDFKKAIGYFVKSASLNPNDDKVYYNLGVCHQEIGDYEKALKFYQKAVQINPKDVKSYYNASLIFLRKGDYEQGFDLYRLRYHADVPNRPTSLLVPNVPIPKLEGFEDKRVLIYDEQGLDKTIDFIRFMPLLKEKIGEIVLRVPEPLQKLLSFNYPDITFSFTLDPNEEMEFDGHFPLLDAGYLLKINKLNIPFKEGYLKVDKEDVERFKKEHNIKDSGKNIGIIWKEESDFSPKTTLLQALIEELKGEGINLYSLQENLSLEEKEILEKEGVESIGEDLEDYYDKASMIANMDRVVGVDTPLTRLSGAMGKKTALLLGKKNDWIWGEKDKRSAWYDSISIYKLYDDNYKKTLKKIAKNIKI
ncbi:MAG: tetratricopeptide repeat protein [Epsilonproteobacteria bacterium]|nr:tetratricopeptide repeat protein [Campylobacterota bacterium]